MRPWVQYVLKIVILVATACSGAVYVQTGLPEGDEGHACRDMQRDRHCSHRNA